MRYQKKGNRLTSLYSLSPPAERLIDSIMRIDHSILNHAWSVKQADALLLLAISVMCISYKDKLDRKRIEDTLVTKVRNHHKTISTRLDSEELNLFNIVPQATFPKLKQLASALCSKSRVLKNLRSREPVPSRGLITKECDIPRFDFGTPRTATPPIMMDDASSIPSTLRGSPITMSDYDEMIPDEESPDDEPPHNEAPNDESLNTQNGGAQQQLSDSLVEEMTEPDMSEEDESMRSPDLGDLIEDQTRDEDDRNDGSQAHPRRKSDVHPTQSADNHQIVVCSGRTPPSSSSASNSSANVHDLNFEDEPESDRPSQLESPSYITAYMDKLRWEELDDQIQTFPDILKWKCAFTFRVIDSDWSAVCQNDSELDHKGGLVGLHGRIQKVIVFRQFEAAVKNRCKIQLSL